MSVEIRPFEPHQRAALFRNDGRAFGFQYSEQDIADREGILEMDRFLVAVDGHDVVGATGAYSKQLTLPGGGTLPAAGVTWVGVAPTHRRRGILRALMERQLLDIAARGEPLAILTASEGGIYERFGYGLASMWRRTRIDARRAVLRDEVGAEGRVRFVDGEEARASLPLAYERYRRQQPGAVTRSEAWWDLLFVDREHERGGASQRFDVVHEDDAGEVDGFARYRIAMDWDDGHPRAELRLTDIATATPAAHAGLWRFLLGVDLVGSIDTWMVSLDDPLPWMLTDWRQVRTVAVNDFLWVRLLDVPAALGARCYGAEDRLVLEVRPTFGSAGGGRFVVEGGPVGASCSPGSDAADLELSVTDLGSVFLGGVSAATLAAAGRIVERTPGAVARADAFFGWPRLPHSTTNF